ncbi:MAG: dual specificity protein phosphatase family protein [Desulfobulbus sp.]|nr:dual specificity protein phosphatase family protein [Desulfobulbus sp.]
MYQLNWITDHLATGHAPMSYEDLESIRTQGIRAIVNLCGEFCDLHQIEEESGFDVYYLPVADECAPDLAEMEKTLDWMDEALYLDKKVLVHCRMGHGRTGTFIAAYLLRRGFDFKGAESTMKGRNANPATFTQRRFLKKYDRQVGGLHAGSPKIDNRPAQDLPPQLHAYEQLLFDADHHFGLCGESSACGREQLGCCHIPFELSLVESMHLSQAANKCLKNKERQQVIDRAFTLAHHLKALHHQFPGKNIGALVEEGNGADLSCPLLGEEGCQIFDDRPPRCRYWFIPEDNEDLRLLFREITALSRQTFLTITGQQPPVTDLRFSSADTLSGKFIELYFQAMLQVNE